VFVYTMIRQSDNVGIIYVLSFPPRSTSIHDVCIHSFGVKMILDNFGHCLGIIFKILPNKYFTVPTYACTQWSKCYFHLPGSILNGVYFRIRMCQTYRATRFVKHRELQIVGNGWTLYMTAL